MSGHTPGPWTVDEPDEGQLVITADSGGDNPEDLAVADAHPRIHPNGRANAKLMAAAPELLAEIKALKEWVSELNVRISQKKQRVGLQVFKRVNAAIAKAEGKS